LSFLFCLTFPHFSFFCFRWGQHRYFPLRFQCIQILLQLSEKTGVFIPLASLILHPLDSHEVRVCLWGRFFFCVLTRSFLLLFCIPAIGAVAADEAQAAPVHGQGLHAAEHDPRLAIF
jgi:hypothetical protein